MGLPTSAPPFTFSPKKKLTCTKKSKKIPYKKENPGSSNTHLNYFQREGGGSSSNRKQPVRLPTARTPAAPYAHSVFTRRQRDRRHPHLSTERNRRSRRDPRSAPSVGKETAADGKDEPPPRGAAFMGDRRGYVAPFVSERARGPARPLLGDGDDGALIPGSPRAGSAADPVLPRRAVPGSQCRLRPSARGRDQALRVVAFRCSFRFPSTNVLSARRVRWE